MLPLLLGLLSGCGESGKAEALIADPPLLPAPTYETTVLVVDENDQPVAGVSVTTPLASGGASFAATVTTGVDGRATLANLEGPVLVVVEGSGFLSEPVVIGRESAGTDVRVRLISEFGPGGRRRIVLHFVGDTMFGRRFVNPTQEGTAVITPGDGGESAREVVRNIVPIFGAADVRSLNLETVVGTLTAADDYPGKQFIVQSPPETVDALDELQANLVTLGNNHIHDYLAAGVISTQAILDAGGIPHVGAGVDAATARAPLILNIAGYSIAVLSYDSVNGDTNNDRLPEASDPIPPGLSPDDLWKYELRDWGYTGFGVTIPLASRRIKEAWNLIVTAEETITSDAGRADLWSSARAVYPELQDYVARRGHGGANELIRSRVRQDVEDMRNAGHDLVIVQFHSGFQYTEAKSNGTRRAAHDAIDSGADLVVGHHSHTLQGLEWYQQKLIFYSLGNFAFDQDLLFTFPSAILRTVFEDRTLIEARVYPCALDNYRPVAVTGSASNSILRYLHELSSIRAQCERIDGIVRKIRLDPEAGVELPRFIPEGTSARVERVAKTTQHVAVDVAPDTVTPLNEWGLVRSRATGGGSLGGVLFGRDIFQWGDFEDVAADKASEGGMHWRLVDTHKRVEVMDRAPSGVRCLRLRRHATNTSKTLARARARVNMKRHRFHEKEPDGSVTPLDGVPSYSLRFQARLYGGGVPVLQFDVYNFQDEIPLSTFFRSELFPLSIPADDAWREVVFDIPAAVMADVGALEANAVLFYVGLEPPSSGTSILLVDDIQFIEWRDTDELYDTYYCVDALRATSGTAPFTVTVEVVE